MRIQSLLILAAALLPLACAHSAEEQASEPKRDDNSVTASDVASADADARRKIVGTWHEAFENAEAQVRYVGDTTYRADGTFHVDGDMTYQGEDMEAVGGGTYRIEGGEICYTFTEGSGPWEESMGKEICEKLLEVSDTKVRYQDHNDSNVTEMTRVSEGSSN